MIGCGTCGHDVEAHADRAVVACIVNDKHPRRCYCNGYLELRTHLLPVQYGRL